MVKPKINIDQYEGLLSPQFIKDVNCFVTEERVRRPNEQKNGMLPEIKNFRDIPNLDISKEDDYFEVINPGPLEGLATNAKYNYQENPDLMEFVSFVIEYIAQNQIFGNGNKRTAFLTGYMILLTYQLANDYEKIVVPQLNDELVEIISKVAIREKEEDSEDLMEFMSAIEERISQNQEK